MKIPKILLTFALVFSSFYPLAASIHTLDFQQKPHIGHFSEFSLSAHPITVVYLLETQQGTQLVLCTMHIDPTDNMVNGFAGGRALSAGMTKTLGGHGEFYNLDPLGHCLGGHGNHGRSAFTHLAGHQSASTRFTKPRSYTKPINNSTPSNRTRCISNISHGGRTAFAGGVNYPLGPSQGLRPPFIHYGGYAFEVKYINQPHAGYAGLTKFQGEQGFKIGKGIFKCSVEYKFEPTTMLVFINEYYDFNAKVNWLDGKKFSILVHESFHVRNDIESIIEVQKFFRDHSEIKCCCKLQFESYGWAYLAYKQAELKYINLKFDDEQYGHADFAGAKADFKSAEKKYLDAKKRYEECVK